MSEVVREARLELLDGHDVEERHAEDEHALAAESEEAAVFRDGEVRQAAQVHLRGWPRARSRREILEQRE